MAQSLTGYYIICSIWESSSTLPAVRAALHLAWAKCKVSDHSTHTITGMLKEELCHFPSLVDSRETKSWPPKGSRKICITKRTWNLPSQIPSCFLSPPWALFSFKNPWKLHTLKPYIAFRGFFSSLLRAWPQLSLCPKMLSSAVIIIDYNKIFGFSIQAIEIAWPTQ